MGVKNSKQSVDISSTPVKNGELAVTANGKEVITVNGNSEKQVEETTKVNGEANGTATANGDVKEEKTETEEKKEGEEDSAEKKEGEEVKDDAAAAATEGEETVAGKESLHNFFTILFCVFVFD